MALSPARRSLANMRRLLAEYPSVQSLTLVSVTSTTGITDGSKIICGELAGGLDSNRYLNAWVLPAEGPQAGVLRRVANQGLNTSTGQLTPTVPWPGALALNTEIELHAKLPPVRHDGKVGLRECINAALRECWVPDRLALVGVNGQPAYDPFTANDWADAEAVFEVYGPVLDPTTNPVPWPGWDVQHDADLTKLGVAPTFAGGAAAQVGLTRTADSLVKRGVVWTTVTDGLQADTDETLLQPELVVAVALIYVYQALASGDDADRAYWSELAQRQRRTVNGMKRARLWHPSKRPSHGVRAYRGLGPKSFWSLGG